MRLRRHAVMARRHGWGLVLEGEAFSGARQGDFRPPQLFPEGGGKDGRGARFTVDDEGLARRLAETAQPVAA